MFFPIAAAGVMSGFMAQQAAIDAQNKANELLVEHFATLDATIHISRSECPYCHRTNQTHGHKSCDGCGAPR